MEFKVELTQIDKSILTSCQQLLQSPAFRRRSPLGEKSAPLVSLDITSNVQQTLKGGSMVCSDNSEDSCKVSDTFCGHSQPTVEEVMGKENNPAIIGSRSPKGHLSPKVEHRGLYQKSPKSGSLNGITSNSSPAKRICIKNEAFSESYEVEEEIGRGKFAVVRRCRHLPSGMRRAAKFLRKRRKGRDCRSEVMKEVTMLEMASVHQRLVDLIEVYETTHEIILVMEFVEGGELFQRIADEDCFEEEEAKRLLRQIVEAVFFLHERNIVHLDIKPQNVLLTTPSRGNIKLCDLGFARPIHSGDDVRDIIGTPDYVAPEILSYEPIHLASDMWSVGVLTYVMLTGCAPFTGDDKQETFLNISQVNLDFPDELFENVSKDAVDFISQLLVHDPRERLTARDCLQHPWLHQPCPVQESPLRQRRALTPPSPDSLADEPLKKCRCQASTPPPMSSTTLTVFDVKTDDTLSQRINFDGNTSSENNDSEKDQGTDMSPTTSTSSLSSLDEDLSSQEEKYMTVQGSVTSESST